MISLRKSCPNEAKLIMPHKIQYIQPIQPTDFKVGDEVDYYSPRYRKRYLYAKVISISRKRVRIRYRVEMGAWTSERTRSVKPQNLTKSEPFMKGIFYDMRFSQVKPFDIKRIKLSNF